jgi:hypothetical protein
MTPPRIALGAVYDVLWSPNSVRVVAFDRDIVMYDTWWPHKGAWAMARLRGTFTYYRVWRDYFEAHSRYVRADPLTEQERQVHRPDLPFAFAQRPSLSWYEPWNEPHVPAAPSSPYVKPSLEAAAIFLSPFGPRDSPKPAVLVHAENGRSFGEAELLGLAKAAQDPLIGDMRLTSGVGIYRSGIKNRIPSYYLWGALSRLNRPAENAA